MVQVYTMIPNREAPVMEHISIRKPDFRASLDGRETDIFFLRNPGGLEMAVSNFGARVIQLWAPDRNGKFEDIVLGHSSLRQYREGEGGQFYGAVIGRYANRIAGACFPIGNLRCQVPANEGENSLQGGDLGFDMKVWDAVIHEHSRIALQYISEDGEEGYPGRLQVDLEYHLTDENEWKITYRARTDAPTVVNLTQHSFFNLKGEGNGTINDHLLMINADSFTPIDEQRIPTGAILPVENTPMDFRRPRAVGSRLGETFTQLLYGGGYDHNWVLNKDREGALSLAASLYEPGSGRYLEVRTTQPGMQFYGGNFFDGSAPGKRQGAYTRRSGLALETQHFPDSPNQAHFPSTILLPGEEYKHECRYKIGVK